MDKALHFVPFESDKFVFQAQETPQRTCLCITNLKFTNIIYLADMGHGK